MTQQSQNFHPRTKAAQGWKNPLLPEVTGLSCLQVPSSTFGPQRKTPARTEVPAPERARLHMWSPLKHRVSEDEIKEVLDSLTGAFRYVTIRDKGPRPANTDAWS